MEQNSISLFRDENAFLSNMFPVNVRYQGIDFQCSESAFQYAKCADPEEGKAIISMGGKASKAAGKKVNLRPDWEEVKLDVMREIIHAKFENPELREKLLATKDAELKEGNTWHDTFWGVDANTGKGQNNLGKILMAEREAIQKELELSAPSQITESEKGETLQKDDSTLSEVKLLLDEKQILFDDAGAAYLAYNGNYLSEERANALEALGVDFSKNETLKRAAVQAENKKKFHPEDVEENTELKSETAEKSEKNPVELKQEESKTPAQEKEAVVQETSAKEDTVSAPAKLEVTAYHVDAREDGSLKVEASFNNNKTIELTSQPENQYPFYMSTLSQIKHLGKLIHEKVAILAGREISEETNTASALVLFNPAKLAEKDAEGLAAYESVNNISESDRVKAQETFRGCYINYCECYKMTKALKMNKAIAEMVEDKSAASLHGNPYMFERVDNSGSLVSYTVQMDTLNELTVDVSFEKDGQAKVVEVPLKDIREKGIFEAVLYTDMLVQGVNTHEARSYQDCPKIAIGRYKTGQIGIKGEDGTLITTNLPGADPYINFLNKNAVSEEMLTKLIDSNICAIEGKGNDSVVPVIFNPEAIHVVAPKSANAYEQKSGITNNDRIIAQERYEFAREAAISVDKILSDLPRPVSRLVYEELISDRIDAMSSQSKTYSFRRYIDENNVVDYDIKPNEKSDAKMDVVLLDSSQNAYGKTSKATVSILTASKKGVLQTAYDKLEKEAKTADKEAKKTEKGE